MSKTQILKLLNKKRLGSLQKSAFKRCWGGAVQPSRKCIAYIVVYLSYDHQKLNFKNLVASLFTILIRGDTVLRTIHLNFSSISWDSMGE